MSETDKRFSPYQEQSIIALSHDEPDFIGHVMELLDPEYFQDEACKFVFTIIHHYWKKHGTIPSRPLTKDIASRYLTVEDPDAPDILAACDFEINPRDIDPVRQDLMGWLKEKAYGELYSDKGLEAFDSGDFSIIDDIVAKATQVQDIGSGGFWFFKDTDRVFQKDIEQKLTSGFAGLDLFINDGGPTRKEVLLWMAPTNGGKSIAIVNTGVAAVRLGLKVLHITMEMSEDKTAARYFGVVTGQPMKKRFGSPAEVEQLKQLIRKEQVTSGGDLLIKEFPADDISVNTITALMDHLRKSYKWVPDVIAIDYMELLLSKNEYFNRDDYKRQKKIATELLQLAKKSNCFIVSGTQCNRDTSGSDGKSKETNLDLNRIAESYGKAMPVDYVVSINQARSEYVDGMPRCRLYIAKNRNGPKFVSITVKMKYDSMVMEEAKEGELDDVKSDGDKEDSGTGPGAESESE